jgi:hypothetical protein
MQLLTPAERLQVLQENARVVMRDWKDKNNLPPPMPMRRDIVWAAVCRHRRAAAGSTKKK